MAVLKSVMDHSKRGGESYLNLLKNASSNEGISALTV